MMNWLYCIGLSLFIGFSFPSQTAFPPVSADSITPLFFASQFIALSDNSPGDTTPHSRVSLQQTPPKAAPSLELGANAFAAGDYPTAILEFSKATEQFPREAHGNLCLAQLQLENYEAAIADFEWVLQHNPQNTQAHLNRGLILAQLHRHQEAIAGLKYAQQQFQEQEQVQALTEIQQLIEQIQHIQRIAPVLTVVA